MNAQEIGEMLRAAGEDRRAAIRECVTWLAQHCNDYRPEYLAGEMARELLEEARQ